MDSEPSPAEPRPNEDTPAGLQIIGIGASAGGISALQTFFRHMPADTGMAFVVILHLPPDYESQAAEVLQRVTAMPVVQITMPLPIAANCIYVIPPTKHLSMVDGTIQLQDPEGPRGRRAPIDLFFRTLADTHGRNAAAVILSGSGADGTIGAQRIKEYGGVVLVQDPQEAEFDAMPRNAIATGLVDYILPVAAIPAKLLDYWRPAEVMRLSVDAAQPTPDAEALHDIFALLRTRTGHDFSHYKRPTLLRRIGRRMQVNNLIDLPAYLAVLRARPEEVRALLRDLLISVTNFFRDPTVWASLAAIIPQSFLHGEAGDQVRAWVAGCATGEEAYSLAMLLYEYATTLDQPPGIQVFASDIDDEAIAVARQGLYPETIGADVSPERLQRFFVVEQGGYRIKKEIRDLVLFAPHNLLRDPPFSKLDLITCRNLLIYLNRDVQEQVLQLFHFSLRPGGYLLLGASESTDGVPGMFIPIDKGQRLFQCRPPLVSALPPLPSLPLVGPSRRPAATIRDSAEGPTHSFSELHAQLLAGHTPSSVIVSEDHDIVHLSRGAGRFLEFTEGEPSHNLLRVVHPSLRLELRSALFAATQKGSSTEVRRGRVDLDGHSRLVDLHVQPIREPDWARGYFMVVFHDLGDAGEIERGSASDAEPVVRQLEEELQGTKDQLRATIEQYETAVEEHKAANEELQAINEELRAATEELETSKEELQSVNEELTTVNQELKHKIEELSQSNNDLLNLMAATEIGTIFIDRELRIRRYTPSAQAIFNLIPADINRPLVHITHRLAYDSLPLDTAHVRDTLQSIEREVRSGNGHWYLARLLPYRTIEDKFDGVSLTFVDITERKQAEAVLQRLHDNLEQRIVERTAELATANQHLEVEIVERRRAEATRGEVLRQVVTAQEEERRRISRELHDQLGQGFSALRVGLAAVAEPTYAQTQRQEMIARLQQIAIQLDEDIDRLAIELRPSALDDLGLRAVLQQHVEEWSSRYAISAEFQATGLDADNLPSEIEIVIYRVVQEALTNVFKHAGAQHVSVLLDHRHDQMRLIVEDDGRGFDLDAVQQSPDILRKLGLVGMGERVALVGGSFTVESTPGSGTSAFIRIPLPLIGQEGKSDA